MFFNFFIKKYDSCNNLTDLGRNNTLTSRQRREHYVTPLARHIIPGIVLPHDLLLGCTLLCRVVIGHTILTRTWVLIIQSLVLTADVFQFFTKNMICVTILPTSGGIILSHQGKERNITSHPSHDILYLILFCHMVCCLVVHCMVVWLTRMQYLHVLVVQRSLTVLRPSQAFHDMLCECRILLTQIAKLGFNHSIGRTHSWRFSIFH